MDLELRSITKRFGPVAALDQVTFRAKGGQIQALVGENGAGKTTLMKCLYGEYLPDQGEITLDGKPLRLRRAADAKEHGIGMVSQHYAIIPELTCLENLMLGAETGEFLALDRARARADKLAETMGFRFDWGALARGLSPGDAQKLEILKLLWRDCRVMILDEPTAMLSPADADALYASLTDLAAKGICVIVVTHRIPEVLEFCREVTVLRGGRLVDSRPVEGLSESQLAELIIGHGVSTSPKTESKPGIPLVELKDATVQGARGDQAVKGATLTLREGEVVGLAGVDGSGQKELFAALTGLVPLAQGSLQLCGQPAPSAPAERFALGLRLVPEDRLSQAVVPGKSLEWNALLGLQRLASFRMGPWVNGAAQKELAGAAAQKFRTKHASLTQPISDLSGGNQQRFVAGRALGHEPKIILAFQPTRGLDIEGTAQIYQEIRRLCREEGAAALVVSFDLDELLEHTDRIAVMCGGILTEAATRDRGHIGRLMVGAA